jgi:hypothetical protein
MKNWVMIGVVLASLIFLIGANGCVQTPTCNKPYILVGNDCCLDKDDNSICDSDETTKEITKEVLTEKDVIIDSTKYAEYEWLDNYTINRKIDWISKCNQCKETGSFQDCYVNSAVYLNITKAANCTIFLNGEIDSTLEYCWLNENTSIMPFGMPIYSGTDIRQNYNISVCCDYCLNTPTDYYEMCTEDTTLFAKCT